MSDDEMPNPELPENFAAAFLTLAETMVPLLDFVEGQRAEFERRGFSPTAAEAMAVTLYMQSISGAFRVNPEPTRRRWFRRS